MQKSGHILLKGVNWVHIDKMKKSGYMVLKGEQLGTQYKSQVI